jgi:hypothetical protein
VIFNTVKKIVVVGGVIILTLSIFSCAFVAGSWLSRWVQSYHKSSESKADVSELRGYDLDEVNTLLDQQAKSSESGWEQLTSQELNLSFSFPSSFSVQKEKPYGEKSLMLLNYSPEAVATSGEFAPSQAKIEMYEIEKPAGQELELWLSERPSEAQNIKRQNVSVAGKKALFEAGYSMGFYAVYYIDRGNNVLIAIIYGNEKEFDKNKELLKNVVSTFQFEGGPD